MKVFNKIKLATLGLSSLLMVDNAFAIDMYGYVGGGYNVNRMSINSTMNNITGTITPGTGGASATTSYVTTPYNAKTNVNPGSSYGINGALGVYIVPSVRGEINLSYQPEKTKTYQLRTAPNNKFFTEFDYKQSSALMMANLFYDFKASENFMPFITLGIGGIYTMVRDMNMSFINDSTPPVGANLTAPSGAITIASDSNKMSFLYQAGVGLGTLLSEGIFLDLDYRIRGVGKVFDDSYTTPTSVAGNTSVQLTGDVEKTKYNHHLSAGLRFNF